MTEEQKVPPSPKEYLSNHYGSKPIRNWLLNAMSDYAHLWATWVNGENESKLPPNPSLNKEEGTLKVNTGFSTSYDQDAIVTKDLISWSKSEPKPPLPEQGKEENPYEKGTLAHTHWENKLRRAEVKARRIKEVELWTSEQVYSFGSKVYGALGGNINCIDDWPGLEKLFKEFRESHASLKSQPSFTMPSDEEIEKAIDLIYPKLHSTQRRTAFKEGIKWLDNYLKQPRR